MSTSHKTRPVNKATMDQPQEEFIEAESGTVPQSTDAPPTDDEKIKDPAVTPQMVRLRPEQ